MKKKSLLLVGFGLILLLTYISVRILTGYVGHARYVERANSRREQSQEWMKNVWELEESLESYTTNTASIEDLHELLRIVTAEHEIREREVQGLIDDFSRKSSIGYFDLLLVLIVIMQVAAAGSLRE